LIEAISIRFRAGGYQKIKGKKKFIGKPDELSLPLSKVLLYQYDKVLPYQVKQFRVR